MKSPLFPSSTLVNLRELMASPFAGPMAALPEAPLAVVDTPVLFNAAQRRRKFKNPNATTNFEEVVASGIVQFIAPPYLRVELERKLAEYGWSADEISVHVPPLFSDIAILADSPAARRATNLRDPNDLSFLEVFEFARADCVLTADEDLTDVCRVIRVGTGEIDVLLDMKMLARAKAESVGRSAMMLVGAHGSVALVRNVGLSALGIVAGFGWLIWLGLEESQKERLGRGAQILLDGVTDFFTELNATTSESATLEARNKQVLAVRSDLSLADRIFRLVLREPATLSTLVRKLLKQKVSSNETIVRRAASVDPRLRVEQDKVIAKVK